MDGKEFKFVKGYVVVHHGIAHEHDVPMFLVSPISGHTPHTFTTNICHADIYAHYSGAKFTANEENERLRLEGHPLAGKVKVGELFVRDYKEEE